ncbi:hypothetical protein [Varibaculum cambriense]|nr:hypothetical protein [Varibaculum cambriense]
MTSRIGKRTIAILAFIALALSVIIPLSVPKAFSAPDTNNLKAYQPKIEKVVSDFTAIIKDKGSYTYRVINGHIYSPALDTIAPGFGEGREIPRLIEDSKYSIEDILGKGASGVGKSHSNVTPDGKTVSAGEFAIFSLTKTVDEAKLKEIITEELGKFLAENPKPSDTTKPGCRKAEVKDYSEGIEKLVKRIGKPISGDNSYLWAINQGLGADHKVKISLDLTDEQVKQVFGENAKSSRSMTGPTLAVDENGKTYTAGEPTEYFGVDDASKFDREAMTKIITDKVSEFLAKNPQEICEGGSDTKPGTNEPTVDPTKPGKDDTKPGNDTKPGDTTEPDAKPADTGKDTPKPDAGDNKPGTSATTDSDNKSDNGAATTSGEDGQTVLEKPAETGGLATTGAAALTALGVSVLLVATGVGLAVYRKKSAGKNV